MAISAMIAIAAAGIFLTSGVGIAAVGGLTALSTSAGITIGSQTLSYAAIAACTGAAAIGVGGPCYFGPLFASEEA